MQREWTQGCHTDRVISLRMLRVNYCQYSQDRCDWQVLAGNDWKIVSLNLNRYQNVSRRQIFCSHLHRCATKYIYFHTKMECSFCTLKKSDVLFIPVILFEGALISVNWGLKPKDCVHSKRQRWCFGRDTLISIDIFKLGDTGKPIQDGSG